MWFESERAAGFDHEAEKGDRYERRTNAQAGRDADASGRDRSSRIFSMAIQERPDFIAGTVRRFGGARLTRSNKASVLSFMGLSAAILARNSPG